MSAAAPPSASVQPASPGDAEGDVSPAASQSSQANGPASRTAARASQSNGSSSGLEAAPGLPAFSVGWAQSYGNRPYQDDRCVDFVLQLPTGSRAHVWAVADGHHQHHVSELVCAELQATLNRAVTQYSSLEQALYAAVSHLDDVVFARHVEGQLVTGGTTLIVHVLTPTHVYTANVGDCKSVLSSRGACVELNTCHNPNVPSERDRFQASRMRNACGTAPGELNAEKPQRRLCDTGLAAPRGFPIGTPRRQQLLAALWRTCCLLRASAVPLAVDWWVDLLGPPPSALQAVGIYCSADHIGGSDINVCRTLGDYDLGMPLKGRDAKGQQLGPLISEPEVCVIPIDEMSEFVITASDGLWDYYAPESSVLSDTRRTMRRLEEDPQQVAEWLLEEALQHQQRTLHPGTPGDNITVMVVRLQPLPPLPRSTGSRLCLMKGSSGDLTSLKPTDSASPRNDELPAPSPRWEAGRLSQQHSLPRQASQQESQLLWRSASARRASADQRQQQEESREQQQRRQSNGSCHL
ncbi:putative protein phosphatase 2C 22 [Chlorella vulgaris]